MYNFNWLSDPFAHIGGTGEILSLKEEEAELRDSKQNSGIRDLLINSCKQLLLLLTRKVTSVGTFPLWYDYELRTNFG